MSVRKHDLRLGVGSLPAPTHKWFRKAFIKAYFLKLHQHSSSSSYEFIKVVMEDVCAPKREIAKRTMFTGSA